MPTVLFFMITTLVSLLGMKGSDKLNQAMGDPTRHPSIRYQVQR